MKTLDPMKFKVENVNHMVDKCSYEGCILGKPCFFMAMGAPFEICEYFHSDAEKPFAECSYEEEKKP